MSTSTNLCYPCPCLSTPRTISTPAPGQPRQLGGAVRLLLLDPVLVSIQCREISDRGDLGRGHSGHCPAFIIHGPASGVERRQCCVNTGHCGGWAEVTRVWCSRDTGDSCSGSMLWPGPRQRAPELVSPRPGCDEWLKIIGRIPRAVFMWYSSP